MRLLDPTVRTQLRGFRYRPGRLLLPGLSVLIAAFVVMGAVLANEMVTRAVLHTFSETPDDASLVVTSQSGLTAPQLAALKDTPGVAMATGRGETMVGVGDGAQGTTLPLTADPGPGPLSALTLLTGSYPDGAGQIAVNELAARRLGVAPGSPLQLRPDPGAPQTVEVTVTAVVRHDGKGGELIYVPDTSYPALGGGDFGWAQVDILVDADTDPDLVADRLFDSLPTDASASIVPAEAQRQMEARDRVNELDDIFALAGMFLAVGMIAAGMVTTSTFRIVFAQRMRQLALLRTVGAQRRQLIRALAAEGAVVGIVASTLGVAAAIVLGLAAPAVARISGHTLWSPGLQLGAAFGVVAAMTALTAVSVLVPAIAAARVAPMQALRTASTTASERGITVPRRLAGLLLTAGTAGLLWLVVTGRGSGDDANTVLLHLAGVGALAFAALVALGPVLVRPVVAVVGWPLRRLGPTGRLAVGVVGGTPRRAAAVSVVVALGVALVAGAAVGTASLRTFVNQELLAEAPADLVMFAGDEPITDDALTRLRAAEDFTSVTPFTMGTFDGRFGSAGAIAIDPAALPRLREFTPAAGSLADLGPGRVVLSRAAADDRAATIGAVVTLDPVDPAGAPVNVTVVAVLDGPAPYRTDAMLDPADLNSLGPAAQGVFADFAAGAQNQDDAVARFRQLGGGAEVYVLADLRAQRHVEISNLFTIALGMLSLTILIAVVGVGTTTSLSVIERTRESGLLRALGSSRSALRIMVGLEAALYGTIGAILGTALGVPLSWLTIGALNLGVPFTVPADHLLLIVAILVILTMGVGVLSARRAARVSPLAALAVD